MHKKIKILFDARQISDALDDKSASRSGIFFASINILREFSKSECADVAAFIPFGSRPQFLEFARGAGIEKITTLGDDFNFIKLAVANVCAYRRNLPRKSAWKQAVGAVLIILRALEKIEKYVFLAANMIRKKFLISKFDAYFSPACMIPDFAKRSRRVKCFLLLHDIIPLLIPECSNKDREGWFYDMFDALDARDHYFSNSLATKRDFLKFSPVLSDDNITVALLAASDDFQVCNDAQHIGRVMAKYNIPAGKKYVLSMCNIAPHKNLIFAIKNFMRFVDQAGADDVVFVLGGGHWGNFMSVINAECGKFAKYKDLVIRAGYIDDADMPALYSGALCFVYPSKYEGFGLPPLEAMQCGAPVVTSNTSSLPEVVGDAGIMVDPNDDGAFVAALMKIYSDSDFRAKLSNNGMKRAKMFSWRATADKMLGVMVDAIKRK